MTTVQPFDRGTREALLRTAITTIRRQGFAGTSVDELCRSAGVTKGAFFHHFATKEDMGVEAAKLWAENARELFAQAEYHSFSNPRDRVLGYIDFRRELITGSVAEFTCYAGTVLQETFATRDSIRVACSSCILDHAGSLECDIQAAIETSAVQFETGARSLALHIQAVLQGAFIIAKATGDASDAKSCIDHLRHYVKCLFSAH